MYTLCHGQFAFSLGVIGRLWSVIVALPGRILYHFKPKCHTHSSSAVFFFVFFFCVFFFFIFNFASFVCSVVL